jgi:NAD(P)-dependent dehydrogenase (short-subunit alcohol dehydrogenase family)
MTVLDRFRLDGRVALVTGGARGLGAAIAKALGEAGAAVAITSRKQVADAFVADVRDPASVEGLFRDVTARFGRLDILVNNAGTTQRASLDDLTTAQWDDVVDTNLRGTWLCSQAAAPHLRASKCGRIINIASMFAHVGMPNRTPYVASKGGVVALTRALAIELAADAVTVNAICPGPFMTSMHDAAARAKMLEAIPLGRWGDPDELSPAVVYLASDAGTYMTGATLTLDGGYTAR